MSVEVNWEALTTGADGERLAEAVRAFIHERFQQVTLPRFIRAVQVHSFEFGSKPPKVEIKDICDPLPDFYEDNHQDGYSSQSDGCQESPSEEICATQSATRDPNALTVQRELAARVSDGGAGQERGEQISPVDTKSLGIRGVLPTLEHPASPLFANLQSPGFSGGGSQLAYFHLPFGPGLSGTATPLAAVAGGHFQASRPDHAPNTNTAPPITGSQSHLETPSSLSEASSRPQSQHAVSDQSRNCSRSDADDSNITKHQATYNGDRDPNDIQIVSHVEYNGDLRLSLTAEILLDYPMPSFVGIPLQLNITGLRFDGIAILAYINKRAHMCFLSPDDAEAFADHQSAVKEEEPGSGNIERFGGLLEEIKVESEIGERENGKQVLKNVGKVERFILEQVRRIFEDEFVYPSFWTFLV